MCHHLAEGPLTAYEQPHPIDDAATDQSTSTPADSVAQAGVRAWAEYTADPEADMMSLFVPRPAHCWPLVGPRGVEGPPQVRL